MSENGEIYTAGKNFTLLPAGTALTNSTSALSLSLEWVIIIINGLSDYHYHWIG